MTFLLDQDTPSDITYSLQALGHQVVALREVLPVDSSDQAVLARAHANNWVMVTCNRDDFLALARSQPHSGIIILVRRNSRVPDRIRCHLRASQPVKAPRLGADPDYSVAAHAEGTD